MVGKSIGFATDKALPQAELLLTGKVVSETPLFTVQGDQISLSREESIFTRRCGYPASASLAANHELRSRADEPISVVYLRGQVLKPGACVPFALDRIVLGLYEEGPKCVALFSLNMIDALGYLWVELQVVPTVA